MQKYFSVVSVKLTLPRTHQVDAINPRYHVTHLRHIHLLNLIAWHKLIIFFVNVKWFVHDGLENILQNVSMSLRLIGFLLDFHYRQIDAKTKFMKTDITRGKNAAQKMLTFNVRIEWTIMSKLFWRSKILPTVLFHNLSCTVSIPILIKPQNRPTRIREGKRRQRQRADRREIRLLFSRISHARPAKARKKSNQFEIVRIGRGSSPSRWCGLEMIKCMNRFQQASAQTDTSKLESLAQSRLNHIFG